MSNNTLALPLCVKSGKERLWLTRFVGSGSTGNVWECRFDDCDDLFAAKVVEVLRPSDADSRQRLRNEFKVYCTLPWTGRITLVNYTIPSLHAAMGRLRAITLMCSSLIYVKAF